MSQSTTSLRALVALCSYPGFELVVGNDGDESMFPWLQVVCPQGVDTRDGTPLPWKGRKWKLSFHMTDTEVVQTVWAAVQRAIIHETCELFKFKGAAIYDRHLDVHLLADLALRGEAVLDGREEPEPA